MVDGGCNVSSKIDKSMAGRTGKRAHNMHSRTVTTPYWFYHTHTHTHVWWGTGGGVRVHTAHSVILSQTYIHTPLYIHTHT